MSKHSLDADNRHMYAARAKEWNEKAKAFENSVKTVENTKESGIIKSGAISGVLNPDSERTQKHA